MAKLSLAFLTVMLVWATMPLVMKLTVAHYSAFDAFYLRLVIALITVQVVRTIIAAPPLQIRECWQKYFWAGVGIFPSGPLAYWSSQSIPSGVYAVIYGLMPVLVYALSIILGGKERLNRSGIVALLISLAGLILLSSSQISDGFADPKGVFVALVSALIFALSIVKTGQLAQQGDVPLFNLIQGSLLYGVICLTVILPVTTSFTLTQTELHGLAGVFYLGAIGSVLSYMAYYYLLKRVSVTSVAILFLATPVLSVLIGAEFNSEQYSINDWLGIAVITGGLLFYALNKPRPHSISN